VRPDNLSDPQATATLLDSIPGSVFAIGDLAYVDGLETEFTRCFDATWDAIARGYTQCLAYMTSSLQMPLDISIISDLPQATLTKGYYSFNYGAWHVVVLNSVCTPAPTLLELAESTHQRGNWLQADLAANPAVCTAALFHSPLYSSTSANATPAVQPFWQFYSTRAPT